MPSSTTAVRFQNVDRHFGKVRAVDNLSLDIGEGEFFALLGPSGSGKTTCLRLIAGFEQPTAGNLEIFGEPAVGVPPYRRNVNTVFQDYALFPHMTVLDNVAYGLMVKGVERALRRTQAEEALNLVALKDYGARTPGQLSGGQRQRVALARALVNQPKVLLLDEPLGALDLKLREQMQEELKALQRRLGITFVFVTHDQGEALSMADRVAIFNEGRIVQVGAPADVYEKPATPFVARFVGSANVFAPEKTQQLMRISSWSSLRPERVRLIGTKDKVETGEISVTGTVASQHYQGAMTKIVVEIENLGRVAASTPGHHPMVGKSVKLVWSRDAMNMMAGEA
jgi:putative spermidine/putrescine transport system ATP-binding protein